MLYIKYRMESESESSKKSKYIDQRLYSDRRDFVIIDDDNKNELNCAWRSTLKVIY